MKRRKVPADAEAAAPKAAEAAAPEVAEAAAPEAAREASPTRGVLRKSAVRRFIKHESAAPMKVREAFFAALESKVCSDLARSVARAKEQKRTTLMSSDA
jgi:histone H3/H4